MFGIIKSHDFIRGKKTFLFRIDSLKNYLFLLLFLLLDWNGNRAVENPFDPHFSNYQKRVLNFWFVCPLIGVDKKRLVKNSNSISTSYLHTKLKKNKKEKSAIPSNRQRNSWQGIGKKEIPFGNLETLDGQHDFLYKENRIYIHVTAPQFSQKTLPQIAKR